LKNNKIRSCERKRNEERRATYKTKFLIENEKAAVSFIDELCMFDTLHEFGVVFQFSSKSFERKRIVFLFIVDSLPLNIKKRSVFVHTNSLQREKEREKERKRKRERERKRERVRKKKRERER
jgi:hypothetical protein